MNSQIRCLSKTRDVGFSAQNVCRHRFRGTAPAAAFRQMPAQVLGPHRLVEHDETADVNLGDPLRGDVSGDDHRWNGATGGAAARRPEGAAVLQRSYRMEVWS